MKLFCIVHIPAIAVGLSAATWSEAGHEEDFLHHRGLEKSQVQIRSGCVWRL